MNIWLEKYQELVDEEESSRKLAEGEWIVDIPERLILTGQNAPYSDMTQVYDERLCRHDDLKAEVDRMPDTPSLILRWSMVLGTCCNTDTDYFYDFFT